MKHNTHAERYRIESEEDWRGLGKKMPYIAFRPEWEVAMIPPFAGAVARFWVRDKSNPSKQASIYLDCFDRLGYMGEPYWEVYPVDGDVERCLLNEVDKLVEIIGESLASDAARPAPAQPHHKEREEQGE